MPKQTKKAAVKTAEAGTKQTSKHGKILLSWTFPEYPVYQRSVAWYFWMGILGGLLILYAMLTANFLFAVIIFLVALIVFAHASRPPDIVTLQITEGGLLFDDAFHYYRDLKKFWIVYEPPEVKNLFFEFKSGWRPRLTIPLQDKDPVKVRKILLKYLDEDLEQEREPLSDQLSRMLKF